MAELTDLQLLSHLEEVLAAPPARPDAAALARLHATLEELSLEDQPINIGTAATHRRGRRSTIRPGSRRMVGHSSVVAASALALALTAGVAAAAVATNTLPGPTRAFAYDVGLPVTSPALFRAQQGAAQLRQSIRAKNLSQEKVLGQELIGDLKNLNFSDLSSIRATADQLLIQVGLNLPTTPNTITTPITTTDTVPAVSVPSVSVPTVTVPRITVPRITVPIVGVPTVTVPSITVPRVTVPSVRVPTVTVPSITVPTVTIPGLTLPTLGNLRL